MGLYKASQWQSGSGRWYVADTSDLAHNSAVWWLPPSIFDLSFTDYIKMLVDKYQVTYLSYNYEKNLLLFSWDNEAAAHKYLLDVNRLARKKKFQNFGQTTSNS